MSLSEITNENDVKTILSYKNGNDGAFKNLIDSYISPLYNFAARIANRNDAPDIVQEVFIKVWRNLHLFDPSKASFKTWIFTIARNTTTDFLRKRRNVLFSDLEIYNGDTISGEDTFLENIPDEDLLPDEKLEKLQDSVVLNNLLDKLSPDSKEILTLHYQEEMTFDEIGKILDRPLNTVKSIHRRAILELRKNLE